MADRDFIGFKFNGHHSSDLGILRVSGGSRYSSDLIPAFNDNSMDIPGNDGAYFFDSFYSQRTFSINIAYDSLTEEQIRTIQQVFNGKDVGDLIFDEMPFKAYTAKVSAPPQLQFICFDEKDEDGNLIRIYKGEGTINFVCYYPYARSVHKSLSEFNSEDYPTKDQWKGASGMKDSLSGYDSFNNSTTAKLYNPGDLEADFCLYLSRPQSSLPISISVGEGANQQIVGQLTISGFSQDEDSHIRINSKTNLIEGCNSSHNLTGKIYNSHITAGDFFKIPLGESTMNAVSGATIEYNYLYY